MQLVSSLTGPGLSASATKESSPGLPRDCCCLPLGSPTPLVVLMPGSCVPPSPEQVQLPSVHSKGHFHCLLNCSPNAMSFPRCLSAATALLLLIGVSKLDNHRNACLTSFTEKTTHLIHSKCSQRKYSLLMS